MSSRLIRRFSEIIGLVDRDFEPKLNSAVQEVVEALVDLPTEKGKASITVTLDFEYEKGMFNLLPNVKVKLPEGQKFRRTPFWAHEGALSTQHPSQIDMFVRDSSQSSVAQSG
jgi:hypothetical protein